MVARVAAYVVAILIMGLASLTLPAPMVIAGAVTFGSVLFPTVAGMLTYLIMAMVLLWRPEGVFKQ